MVCILKFPFKMALLFLQLTPALLLSRQLLFRHVQIVLKGAHSIRILISQFYQRVDGTVNSL